MATARTLGVSGRMLMASLAATVGLACVIVCGPRADAVDPEPDRLTVSEMDESPVVLSPGETDEWVIGVTTQEVTLESLLLGVSSTGTLAEQSVGDDSSLVMIEVNGCERPWTETGCSMGERALLGPIPLGSLPEESMSLEREDGTVPEGMFISVSATLSADAGNDARGLGADVVARVDAAGEPRMPGVTPAPEPGEAVVGLPTKPTEVVKPVEAAGTGSGPGGSVAATGLVIGGYGLLGLAAVALGAFVASVAARRREGDAR